VGFPVAFSSLLFLGAGYVLSKKALRKFVEKLFQGNNTNCIYNIPNGDPAMDDIYTGQYQTSI
jgi:hypothetical protein